MRSDDSLLQLREEEAAGLPGCQSWSYTDPSASVIIQPTVLHPRKAV